MKSHWFLTPSWHSQDLWGFLGWWLRRNEQMERFPHQTLVVRQWWLPFIRNNVFLKLAENTHLKDLSVLEADKILSWNYPKKSKRGKKKPRKKGCMSLGGRPGFIFFQKDKWQSFGLTWRWRPRVIITLCSNSSHLNIIRSLFSKPHSIWELRQVHMILLSKHRQN